MGRKKVSQKELLLRHHLQTNVSTQVYERLSGLQKKSDCSSISELIRRILSKEKVTLYHRDASFDSSVNEMVRLRKELKAIGSNIHQIMHYFHKADSDNKKIFYALKVADQYKLVGQKVDELFQLIAELGRKWLRR